VQAFSTLAGIADYKQYVVAPFVFIYTMLVVVAGSYLRPVISVFTLAKGLLLFVMVIVTGIVALSSQSGYDSEWVYIGKPILVSVVLFDRWCAVDGVLLRLALWRWVVAATSFQFCLLK
jgi:hypothetical protein